jgi:hypothetical protein
MQALAWLLVVPIVVSAMAIALGLGVRAPELLLGVMLPVLTHDRGTVLRRAHGPRRDARPGDAYRRKYPHAVDSAALSCPATIDRFKDQRDGANILFAFVFVSAVTENVAASIATAPLLTLGLCCLAFAVFFAIFLATTFVRWAGRKQALALAFMASRLNMGLMRRRRVARFQS